MEAMVQAKTKGMPNANEIGFVMMLGDALVVHGRGEWGQRVMVDVNQPAPKLEDSVQTAKALNQQQASLQTQQQNTPTQDDPGPKLM